jgi:acetylornithine/LysW-gamma-L-lysine aminotransferase
MDIFSKRPLSIVRGSGALLYDADGNEYIDCGANYGTCNIGHCNPEVVKAIKAQSEQLIYISSTYYNEQRGKLMEKLIEITAEPLSKVFLCNSGSEAVEAAIKFARASTSRPEIIAMTRAFHGRTLGALSATFESKYRKPFEPLLEGFLHVSYGNIEALKEKISDQTAAVIIEPVIGEGGVVLPPSGYFQDLRKVCTENNTLLIIDEIQTGFARTGKMFAYEYHDISPDLLCLGKSIAGGLPMGAVVATKEACDIPKNSHGSTFGGNPFTCAAANASIQYIIDNNLPLKAAELGEHFLGGLQTIKEQSSIVRKARGLGLMLGLELKTRNSKYLMELMQNGVLALPAGKNVIRFLPPLVINQSQIDFALEKLGQVLGND